MLLSHDNHLSDELFTFKIYFPAFYDIHEDTVFNILFFVPRLENKHNVQHLIAKASNQLNNIMWKKNSLKKLGASSIRSWNEPMCRCYCCCTQTATLHSVEYWKLFSLYFILSLPVCHVSSWVFFYVNIIVNINYMG
jgi:hypothetical protein